MRQKGFEDAINGKDGIETVAVVDSQNVQDTALAAAENLITGNPDMNAIYATAGTSLWKESFSVTPTKNETLTTGLG
ncbi:hypothetical protein MPLSOD_140004 [Mesorhizobium sp. SOD10]|nr:hypothetical protein MPLSOD_140004 [Mesorhizobium sp. SOD10]